MVAVLQYQKVKDRILDGLKEEGRYLLDIWSPHDEYQD